jgi:hypothetical protein
MRTIQVLHAGRDDCLEGTFGGNDAEGVMLYLSAKGVSPDEIAKALTGVAQVGGCRIQQAS